MCETGGYSRGVDHPINVDIPVIRGVKPCTILACPEQQKTVLRNTPEESDDSHTPMKTRLFLDFLVGCEQEITLFSHPDVPPAAGHS